ncbi:MAG TPA: glycosyltransferase family 2 protein [Verrucomicrobiae bacterium]|nr:glycosyltransferase family 2 protein [Verrucomicrobiae bacterium]
MRNATSILANDAASTRTGPLEPRSFRPAWRPGRTLAESKPPLMRFSIITPSFRNSDWLKLCIASVRDQGVAVEHIVQDAGSDDGTLDWLCSDTRVRPFVEKDEGMYDAINRGLRRASGELLAYLNCDEQYLAGALAAVEAHFREHKDTDVLFCDAVVVDSKGNYLWHRKTLRPLPWHTWICPLSVLTCATFFRRSVVERGLLFDPRWRYVGDSAWVKRLLQARVQMGVLRRFTSAFTHSGGNLSLDPKAQIEVAAYFQEAPRWLRAVRPAVLLHHRLRRWLGGIYSQRSFDFALYTQENLCRRTSRHVARPVFRWRW